MVNKEVQKTLAEKLLKLHHNKKILLLPNAWDVIAAKIFEQLGFKAIGTTSAGIAATFGYPDGQVMSLGENLIVVKRIVAATNLPVSADIESGYSITTEGAVNTAKKFMEIGVVGINLEDSTGNEKNPFFEVVEVTDRIRAIRAMSESRGVHLIINLRTDVYLLGKEKHTDKFKNTVKRANIYKEAGADCVYVPDMGDFDEQIITELVKEINAPLNIIAGPNIPPVKKLEEIGVARLSFGPRPMRAMLALLVRIKKELLDKGTYDIMSAVTLSYEDINIMLGKTHN